MRARIVIVSLAVALLAGAGAVVALNIPQAPPATSFSTPEVEPTRDASAPDASTSSTPAPDVRTTAESLLFMIEEEKLAHDVYVTLGSLWGSNFFVNISGSESAHQELLLPLLDVRGLTDPRSPEVGVFVNPDLQALYDDLIARGSLSQAEGVQVGILIEEKDITDIAAAIEDEDEADVISAYERLLSGSENHLAAFQRQV